MQSGGELEEGTPMHDDYGEEGGRLIGNNKIRSRRISIRDEGGSKSEDGNYALRAF